MKPKPKTPKPVRAWCVVSPNGRLMPHCVGRYQDDSKSLVVGYHEQTWGNLEMAGYHCIEVEIRCAEEK